VKTTWNITLYMPYYDLKVYINCNYPSLDFDICISESLGFIFSFSLAGITMLVAIPVFITLGFKATNYEGEWFCHVSGVLNPYMSVLKCYSKGLWHGRRIFGVGFPILKGRQLRINHSNSKSSFSTNRILVTRITTAKMAQIEIKWDLRSGLPVFPSP